MYTYIVLAAVLLQTAYSESDQCYFCNTEVHGEGCNEPVDLGNTFIQRCSDSELISTQSSFKEFSQFKNAISKSSNVSLRSYNNNCIYMTYTFDSKTVSARGCEVEFIDTNIGTLTICEYYEALVPLRITNFICNVCSGNLCNVDGSGNMFLISLPLMLVTFAIQFIFLQ
ncbi:hypothetical protein ABEB36_008850 [Hypothenemus hampei]|uniref:Protein sleepless n=1 Tax=Hypothenemus hampei TaxID=57062 RepID=A0ABD1EN90_HYPHA